MTNPYSTTKDEGSFLSEIDNSRFSTREIQGVKSPKSRYSYIFPYGSEFEVVAGLQWWVEQSGKCAEYDGAGRKNKVELAEKGQHAKKAHCITGGWQIEAKEGEK